MRNAAFSSSFHYVLFLSVKFSLMNSLASAVHVRPNINYLEKGASLSVEDDTRFITSPDDSFAFGFYEIGTNAYSLAIWFLHSRDKTPVWMANRDRPVNGHGSKVSLEKNGALVLTDIDGAVAWQSNTIPAVEVAVAVARAELLNSGNLVLRSSAGDVLWQSFDYPTDTLLPTQTFTKSKRLVSSSRKGSYESGYFNLIFDSDNILRMIYDGPEISSIYWPNPDERTYQNGRTNYNSSRIAVLDHMGRFSSSDGLNVQVIDTGFGIKRRMTLDYDGNLRVHSLINSTGLWQVSWQALAHPCSVRGLCGRNGICIYSPEAPTCSCPPGFVVTDPGDWNKGCRPTFNPRSSFNQAVKFVKIPHVDYYGFDLNYTQSVSLENCKKSCQDDPKCQAFNYRMTGSGECYPKSALFNGYESEETIFLKVPQNLSISEPVILQGSPARCGSTVEEIVMGSSSMYGRLGGRVRWIYIYSFGFTLLAIEFLLVILGWFFLFRKNDISDSVETGYHMIASLFRRFSYDELVKATKNFKEELGRGGSGVVYKGVLADGRAVGVKRLGDVLQAGEEFWAEMNIIGKINHMNLVRTWGYCAEKKRRLLVMEYLENSSLDKHLFSSKSLEWKQRFAVALGTAKGLAYLHDECLEWVIHCDIKPENILLDGDLLPKIADFGLAKLFQRGGGGGPGSELTRIRGTKGYMAPEWTLNQPITAKVDVYSYGVVILEIVRGIRLSNLRMMDDGNTEQEQETEMTKLMRTIRDLEEESWMETVVDPRLEGKFSKKQAMTLIKVGFSCIHEDRNKRPRMANVVETLLQSESSEDDHT